MQKISFAWAGAASFLAVGGLLVAFVPLVLNGVEGDLFFDAAFLFGSLGGGFVAALASRRRSIGEVGLGALLALLIALGASLLYASAEVIDSLGDTALLDRTVRLSALLCVGAMAGAGLGYRAGQRWLGGERIEAPAFWFVVGGLASVAATFLVAALIVQLALSSGALGFIMLILGPATGGFIAQHMAPVRRRRSIAIGCAAVPTLAIASSPDSLQALGGFPIPWLCSWIGAVISTRLREPPGDAASISVPQARVED